MEVGHPGVLPENLRISSAIAAVLYGLLAAMIGFNWRTALFRRRALSAVAVLIAVGTVMNALSPSVIERAIWTPTAALLAYSLWKVRL